MGTLAFAAIFESSCMLSSCAPSSPVLRFLRPSTSRGASAKASSSLRPSGVRLKKLLFLACRNS